MYVSKDYVFLCLLAWTHAVSASPISADLSSTINNLGYGPIPRDFQVHHDVSLPWGGSEEAVFINIVQAVKEIAKGDLTGQMPTRDFRTARYPQPLISLRAPHSDDIKREYAIWGLLLSLIWMESEQNFHWVHFTLLWNDVEVGGIGFGHPRLIQDALSSGPNVLKPDGGTDFFNKTTTGSKVTNTTTASMDQDQTVNLRSPSNNRLLVEFTYVGGNIRKRDYVISLVLTMAVAAIPPSSARIQGRWSPGESETTCRFLAQAAPRETTPFLQYTWLIDALAEAADYLVQHNTYRALGMFMRVDGVRVGNGIFHNQEHHIAPASIA